MPQWEICKQISLIRNSKGRGLTPDSEAERCENGPEDELTANQSCVKMAQKATNSIVDIGDGFYCFRPGKPSAENSPDWLFLPSSINMEIILDGHLDLRTLDQLRHLPHSACHFDDPVRRCMPYPGEIPYFIWEAKRHTLCSSP